MPASCSWFNKTPNRCMPSPSCFSSRWCPFFQSTPFLQTPSLRFANTVLRLFGERRTRHKRTQGEAQANAGRDTNERRTAFAQKYRESVGNYKKTGCGNGVSSAPPSVLKHFSQQTFFPNDTTRTNQRNKKEPARRHERPREPVDARKRTGL